MSTMTPKERIVLQVKIYRDLAKQNRYDQTYYEEKTGEDEWAGTGAAVAKSRAVVYEMVADTLQEILDDWTEDENDGK